MGLKIKTVVNTNMFDFKSEALFDADINVKFQIITV